MNRQVATIVIHCSATTRGLAIGAREINSMHLGRDFKMIGYHYAIRINGKREVGRRQGVAGVRRD